MSTSSRHKKKRKIKKSSSRSLPEWYVYILECRDRTFYTGITKDLDRRLEQHNRGRASRYTRARIPLKLVYSEICRNHSRALRREWEIKSFPRSKKEMLVKGGGRLKV